MPCAYGQPVGIDVSRPESILSGYPAIRIEGPTVAEEQSFREPQLVVIGASAGGIQALSTLLAALPADFPAPIVIAQHLDPKRPSHLAEILTRHSRLPVRIVTAVEDLAPGVVYVVPANRDVEVTDRQVRVREATEGGPVPSVDLLLTSAAKAYGERLIAVILTGTGSDGAAGAREVKEAGGTVVVQNPETASFPGMPQSLPSTVVDVVANLEAIGPLLNDLVTGAYLPTRPSDERVLENFLARLRERSGIDFSTYRRPTILRRLQRRIAATGVNTLREYIRYTEQHPEEYQRLASSFLIKVTEFFRDPELFDYLRTRALPEIIQRARGHGNTLRFWSAGCATGEEAYSLAILLADVLGDELEQFHIRIFATDLDMEAITFARRGIYLPAALAGVPAEIVERYFTPADHAYEVKKFIRSLVIFGQHDLGQRAPFPHIDLILCRNVLIYFTTELQKRALESFAFALREGGLLVLGKAETTSPLTEYFMLEDARLKVYRRYGKPVLLPSAPLWEAVPAPRSALRLVPRSIQASSPGSPPMPALGSTPRLPLAGEKAERLFYSLPVGIVVVDRRYDIQSINSAARRLLGINQPAVGDDFLHLAQSLPQRPLRAAIDAALRGKETTLEEVEVEQLAHEEPRFLQIRCSPYKLGSGPEPVDSVLLLVSDVTSTRLRLHTLEQQQAALQRELEALRARTQQEIERLTARIQTLTEHNQQLLDANQELIAVNEELTAARDAFLLGQEEAQAAIEEVETLNEEVQASNEELETLNEELHATIEELNTTNADLEARSSELQELASRLEAERARLTTILASMGDAVLVVDAAGTPVLTNAAYDRLFAGDLAQRPLEDEQGRPLPPEQTPQQRAARGEAFDMQFTIPIGTEGERRWFEANGRPIQHGEEAQGVVVIREITERSLRRLQDEFMAAASHELRTPLTALRGRLELLVRRLQGKEAEAEALRQAMQALSAADRLAKLANALLDVSRLRTGKFHLQRERVDLAALLAQVIEQTQPLALGQRIELDQPGGPVVVDGDPHRLEQVFTNLLMNAIQYAPGTERIDVRLRRVNGQAEVEVQDYGVGIPPEEMPRLFSRFYQGRQAGPGSTAGLGLGLYISREIVRAHSGDIGVRSEVGKGATFTVWLPLAEQASPPAT